MENINLNQKQHFFHWIYEHISPSAAVLGLGLIYNNKKILTFKECFTFEDAEALNLCCCRMSVRNKLITATHVLFEKNNLFCVLLVRYRLK